RLSGSVRLVSAMLLLGWVRLVVGAVLFVEVLLLLAHLRLLVGVVLLVVVLFLLARLGCVAVALLVGAVLAGTAVFLSRGGLVGEAGLMGFDGDPHAGAHEREGGDNRDCESSQASAPPPIAGSLSCRPTSFVLTVRRRGGPGYSDQPSVIECQMRSQPVRQPA